EPVVVPLRVETHVAGDRRRDDGAARVAELHTPAREYALRRIIHEHLPRDRPGARAWSGIDAAGRRWRGLRCALPLMGMHLPRVRAMLVALTVVANGALRTLGHADEEWRRRQRKHDYEGSHRSTPPVRAEEGRCGLSGSVRLGHPK